MNLRPGNVNVAAAQTPTLKPAIDTAISRLGMGLLSWVLLSLFPSPILGSMGEKPLPLRSPFPMASQFPSGCPLELEPLVDSLVQDLPSYANRVSQRARFLSKNYLPYTVLVAGRPEFEPLPLGVRSQLTPALGSESTDRPHQVFITTLERGYRTGKLVRLQQYHWLFFDRNDRGWWLVSSLSSTGQYPGGVPPSPPEESSGGVVAQAIQLWLRDCRARWEEENHAARMQPQTFTSTNHQRISSI